MQVLGLSADAQLVERLRAQPQTGARHILAKGEAADEALRAALAAPDKVAGVVLLAPPTVEALASDIAGRLGTLQVPVLALFGTEDRVSPPALGAAWRRALPKAFVTFVFGAAGDMDSERPQAVATLIADFFARGENFLVKITEDRLYP